MFKKIIFTAATAALITTLCGCSAFPGFCLWGNAAHSNTDRSIASDSYSFGDFSYHASEVDEVRINWTSGKLSIIQSDKDELNVTETGGVFSDELKVHWKIEGRTLYIVFSKPGSTFKHTPFGEKRLNVEIPSGITLYTDVTSADVTLCEHSLDKAYISSTSGTIKAAGITGNDINISSVSGNIKISDICCEKDMTVSSTSGSIDFNSVFSQSIDIESVSGSVALGLSECHKLNVSTTSGSIRIYLSDRLGATLSFKTVSGSLHADNYSVKSNYKVFGDGSCDMRIETVSGNLTIKE